VAQIINLNKVDNGSNYNFLGTKWHILHDSLLFSNVAHTATLKSGANYQNDSSKLYINKLFWGIFWAQIICDRFFTVFYDAAQ